MFVGDLHENDETQNHLTASRPYFYDELTWCVQKCQPQELWKQIFYISKDVWFWVLILVYAAIAINFAYFLQQYEERPATFSHIFVGGFSYFLNISYPYAPKQNANRILFASFMLGCLLINLTFTTYLFRTVTSPYRKIQAQTIDDILRDDFKLVGERFALVQLWRQGTVTNEYLS